MKMLIREVASRSLLSKSGIPGVDYCVNPYTGCAHACRYCYAEFMKKFTGHREPWGSFVDVKANAPEVLRRQLKRARRGTVMLSSVTDPYQPVESKYRLTRQCLAVLLEYQFPVDVLTKSPLVVRDADLIARFKDIDIGLTITTDNERVRKAFEPNAPPVAARLRALKELHEKGISTYVFIGPVLPMNPEKIIQAVSPYADSILIDRMNYPYKTAALYRKMQLSEWLDSGFISRVVAILKKGFSGKKVSIC